MGMVAVITGCLEAHLCRFRMIRFFESIDVLYHHTHTLHLRGETLFLVTFPQIYMTARAIGFGFN